MSVSMTRESTPSGATAVAYRALNAANKAQDDIVAHEDLCAERYANINTTIGEIKSILKWFGSTIFILLVGVAGWSIKAQLASSDDAQQAKLEAAIRGVVVQQQEAAPRGR
jgi:hypothetical protein